MWFGDSFADCSKSVETTLTLLTNLDFVINKSKCKLIPSQNQKVLEFILDFENMCISLPNEKRIAELEHTKKNQIARFVIFQA